MLLTMVFGLFSIGFPMDFHGEGFRGIPYSSQSFPVASQRVLTPSETKVEDPTDQSFPRWKKKFIPRSFRDQTNDILPFNEKQVYFTWGSAALTVVISAMSTAA